MKNLLSKVKQCSLLGLMLVLAKQPVAAQCIGCTTTYASNFGGNITVSTGATVCINTGVIMSGQVFLNGGVICNKGTINNLKLHGGKGIIQNYGIITDSETAISFGGNVSVYSYSASKFDISGVAFNTSSMDSLFFKIFNGGKVKFISDLPITAKKLSVYNGIIDPAAPANITTSYFSVGNDLSVDHAQLRLYNSSTGVINVTGAVNLSNNGDKTIKNYGVLNINNDLYVGGDGLSVTSVLIENSDNLYVMGALIADITNANFNLNNLVNTGTGITVDSDILLTEVTHTLVNSGKLNVGNSMELSGIITNNETISAHNSMTVHTSFTNNHITQSGV